MDPDMRKLSLGLDKKIENLLIEIRSVGKSLHYVQQACMSNLREQPFVCRGICSTPSSQLFITDAYLTLFNFRNGRPTRKELTAGPHARAGKHRAR